MLNIQNQVWEKERVLEGLKKDFCDKENVFDRLKIIKIGFENELLQVKKDFEIYKWRNENLEDNVISFIEQI